MSRHCRSARPGGNTTGFLWNEPPLGGKWIQLLEYRGGLRLAAVLFNSELALMVELIAAALRDNTDIFWATTTASRSLAKATMADPLARSARLQPIIANSPHNQSSYAFLGNHKSDLVLSVRCYQAAIIVSLIIGIARDKG